MDIKLEIDVGRALRHLAGAERQVRFAAAVALTRTAQAARADLTRAIPHIFESVVPLTARSVRFKPANMADGFESMFASVYIQNEAPKGTPPSKYLRAEILGGERRDKRSERALIAAGIMTPGQQWVPGGAQHHLSGPAIVRVLSRVKAFGEQGYRANASEATKRKLRKSGVLTHRATGTNYFIAHDKATHEPLAIYEIVSSGHVRPVLWFINRHAHYHVRFPFFELVEASARKNWPREIAAALAHAAPTMR